MEAEKEIHREKGHRHTNLEIDTEIHRERERVPGTCFKQQVRDGRARRQARGAGRQKQKTRSEDRHRNLTTPGERSSRERGEDRERGRHFMHTCKRDPHEEEEVSTETETQVGRETRNRSTDRKDKTKEG